MSEQMNHMNNKSVSVDTNKIRRTRHNATNGVHCTKHRNLFSFTKRYDIRVVLWLPPGNFSSSKFPWDKRLLLFFSLVKFFGGKHKETNHLSQPKPALHKNRLSRVTVALVQQKGAEHTLAVLSILPNARCRTCAVPCFLEERQNPRKVCWTFP